MQVYSGNGFKLSGKSKSNMAEFSLNPDGRKKSEVSYHKYITRKKEENNQRMTDRIRINNARYEQGLETFLNQDMFDEIIEECEFEKEQLWNFLLTYNLQLNIDENLSEYTPIEIDKKMTMLKSVEQQLDEILKPYSSMKKLKETNLDDLIDDAKRSKMYGYNEHNGKENPFSNFMIKIIETAKTLKRLREEESKN